MFKHLLLSVALLTGCVNSKYVPIVDNALPSVVRIEALVITPKGPGVGLGAGALISPAGHILTCAHVVPRGTLIAYVTTYDGGVYPVTLLRRDFKRDVALLKIEPKQPLPFLALAAREPAIGEEVVAIGHPLGLNWSVTTGVISGLSREGLAVNLMQTDAAINGGNSGGPLINLRGEIVGLNESKIVDASNLGFAVSVAEIRSFLAIFAGLEMAQ